MTEVQRPQLPQHTAQDAVDATLRRVHALTEEALGLEATLAAHRRRVVELERELSRYAALAYCDEYAGA